MPSHDPNSRFSGASAISPTSNSRPRSTPRSRASSSASEVVSRGQGMARGIAKAGALACVVAVAGLLAIPADGLQALQPGTAVGGYHPLLDLYVRDGYVYYRTLKNDRSRLDRYVASLAAASIDGASPPERLAFWLNAYNALVLKTVIDRIPIPQRSKEYPAGSIRQ